MKKVLLASMALIAGFSASAQRTATHYALKPLQTKEVAPANFDNLRGSRQSAYSDTVWFDSFEDSTVWEFTNQGTAGWEISSTTGTNAGTWYFANTRIQSTTGGNYAVMAPGDPNAALYTSHIMNLRNAIDISAFANQNLVLSYEKYGARFYDTLKVEVSNDNMNWTLVSTNTEYPLLSTAGGSPTPNPASNDLFIPASVVNGDSLYIRFNWDANNQFASTNGVGYGWFIDDVSIFDVPTNDIALDLSAFFDTPRILYNWYYGVMPEEQAATDSITFSAAFSNRGSADQPNTRLEIEVTGKDNQSFASSTRNLAAGFLGDTAFTTTNYAPSNGIGTYTITWNIASDSTDEIPSNNMVTIDLDVSDNEFCMPPLPVSEANIVGKAGTGAANVPYTLTQDYVFNTSDTITSVGLAFDSEWSRAGSIFKVNLLDGDDNILSSSEIFTLTNEMITDDMVYFPISEVAIASGVYGAQLEVFSDSVFLVACQDPAPPIEPAPGGGFFSRTTLSYGGSNFIEDMAYISLRTKTQPICNPNATVSGNVDDTNSTFLANINITNISGLTGIVYTYAWTGPAGFTSNAPALTGLTNKGVYTVVVSDAEGCSVEQSFTVDGNVGVAEASFAENLNIYPNPNNGNFNMTFSNMSGEFDVTVVSAIGQVVATRTVNVNNSYAIEEFNAANLGAGIYFVTVENKAEATKAVKRVIVK